MELFSAAEVALIYGFSSSQIRRLIRQGIIKAEKVGSYYIIKEKDVRNLKKRRKKKQDDNL